MNGGFPGSPLKWALKVWLHDLQITLGYAQIKKIDTKVNFTHRITNFWVSL